MLYDIQYKINSDINLKKFLRENSYWYKELNRNPENFKYFVEDMKIKYKLTPADKINRTVASFFSSSIASITPSEFLKAPFVISTRSPTSKST